MSMESSNVQKSVVSNVSLDFFHQLWSDIKCLLDLLNEHCKLHRKYVEKKLMSTKRYYNKKRNIEDVSKNINFSYACSVELNRILVDQKQYTSDINQLKNEMETIELSERHFEQLSIEMKKNMTSLNKFTFNLYEGVKTCKSVDALKNEELRKFETCLESKLRVLVQIKSNLETLFIKRIKKTGDVVVADLESVKNLINDLSEDVKKYEKLNSTSNIHNSTANNETLAAEMENFKKFSSTDAGKPKASQSSSDTQPSPSSQVESKPKQSVRTSRAQVAPPVIPPKQIPMARVKGIVDSNIAKKLQPKMFSAEEVNTATITDPDTPQPAPKLPSRKIPTTPETQTYYFGNVASSNVASTKPTSQPNQSTLDADSSTTAEPTVTHKTLLHNLSTEQKPIPLDSQSYFDSIFTITSEIYDTANQTGATSEIISEEVLVKFRQLKHLIQKAPPIFDAALLVCIKEDVPKTKTIQEEVSKFSTLNQRIFIELFNCFKCLEKINHPLYFQSFKNLIFSDFSSHEDYKLCQERMDYIFTNYFNTPIPADLNEPNIILELGYINKPSPEESPQSDFFDTPKTATTPTQRPTDLSSCTPSTKIDLSSCTPSTKIDLSSVVATSPPKLESKTRDRPKLPGKMTKSVFQPALSTEPNSSSNPFAFTTEPELRTGSVISTAESFSEPSSKEKTPASSKPSFLKGMSMTSDKLPLINNIKQLDEIKLKSRAVDSTEPNPPPKRNPPAFLRASRQPAPPIPDASKRPPTTPNRGEARTSTISEDVPSKSPTKSPTRDEKPKPKQEKAPAPSDTHSSVFGKLSAIRKKLKDAENAQSSEFDKKP